MKTPAATSPISPSTSTIAAWTPTCRTAPTGVKTTTSTSVVSIERIGDAPPEPLRPAQRPLSGVRVLDLTRVIAGPVCGRTLAAHGADVLLVTSPNLPAVLVADTGRGKLSAHLDLKQAEGRATLEFFAAWRRRLRAGLPPGRDAESRLRAGARRRASGLGSFTHRSALMGRRVPGRDGADSIAWCRRQAASTRRKRKRLEQVNQSRCPPRRSIMRRATLLAFGVLTALLRRVNEGGSWQVRVSLARTGHWLRGLGRLPQGFDCPEFGANRATGSAGGDRLPIRSPCRDPSCRAPGRHTAPLATSFGPPRDGSAPLAGISSGQRLDISARPASRAMCRRSGPV